MERGAERTGTTRATLPQQSAHCLFLLRLCSNCRSIWKCSEQYHPHQYLSQLDSKPSVVALFISRQGTPATMMLRTRAPRSILRSCTAPNSSIARATYKTASSKAQLVSSVRSLSSSKFPRNLALSPYRPTTTALQRYASNSTGPPYGPTRGVVDEQIDHKAEEKQLKSEIPADPENVSVDSSTVPILEGRQNQDDAPMLAGVYQDLVGYT